MINKTDLNSQVYLQTILRKSINEITKADLDKIISFSFNSKCYDGSENITDYSIVELLPNLNEVCIENTHISNDIMKKILKNNKIKSLIFVKCAFYDDFDFSIFKSIDNMKLLDCYVDDYNELLKNLNLDILIIQRQQDDNVIDINFINNSEKLKTLKLEECKISNIDCIEKLVNCDEISLLWSEFEMNKNVFHNMKSLKKLYIDEKYNKLLNDYNIEINNDYVENLFFDDEIVP